jgi:putative membrane protein insertion efficiency factor
MPEKTSIRRDLAEKRRTLGVASQILLALITLYRLTLSVFMGRRCRYLPTCSEYSAEAIARHGAWRGLWLALARISRCHPWGGKGFDPVPESLPEARCRPWRLGRWRMPK